ncbi:serine/threonine-protein kinase [Dictyobacter aurantiacus]|uniref:non-specific serine/threonine protein kinase n=1 Tax=Dictyobacter aurantiacus TaxID=1936993 RepID=A0A401ZF38_9CHLR|nr:serine/threonine-protein kinase [Dictyobacter aurantiacus]GCE05477.1 hypothetical protein KDAU_28060 [Dictyobacter aurantiacus]
MADYTGRQFGHYRLLRLLGQGGFADVYLGEHIHLGSFAAIKILYARLIDEYRERFINEARTLAHLSHPHIIRLLDFGIENEIPFLIMEYAPHGTLRQRHPPKTKLPLSTVVDYMNQIADGLQYAHEHQLIHRDLKPSNILIGPRNNLLLSDFGVALIAQTVYSQSVENSLVGTVAYVAPEQLKGKPQLASDQYSLGIIAYEWLCGTRPFQGTLLEMWAQHQSTVPAPLRQYVADLPPEAERVVLTALAKDPGQRFATVQAFAAALEEASGVEKIMVAPTQGMPPSEQTQIAQNDSITLKAMHKEGHTPPPADITEPDAAEPHVISNTTNQDSFTPQPGALSAPNRQGRKKKIGIAAIVAFVLLLLTSTLVYAINGGGLISSSTPPQQQASNEDKIVGKEMPSPTSTHHAATSTRTHHSSATPTIPVVLPTQAPIIPTTAPTPTPKPTPTSRPPVCPALIQSGASGALVKTLQTSLNSHYAAHDFPNSPYNFSPPLTVDGDFGPLTQSAVKDYQKAHGLEVDGQVGPQTWHSLGYC